MNLANPCFAPQLRPYYSVDMPLAPSRTHRQSDGWQQAAAAVLVDIQRQWWGDGQGTLQLLNPEAVLVSTVLRWQPKSSAIQVLLHGNIPEMGERLQQLSHDPEAELDDVVAGLQESGEYRAPTPPPEDEAAEGGEYL